MERHQLSPQLCDCWCTDLGTQLKFLQVVHAVALAAKKPFAVRSISASLPVLPSVNPSMCLPICVSTHLFVCLRLICAAFVPVFCVDTVDLS